MISKNEKHYLEMSYGDLQSCNEKINGFYICPSIQVLNKIEQPSCLTSLYFTEHKNVSKLCRLSIKKAKPMAVSLGENKFGIYNGINGKTYKMYCKNTSETQRIQLRSIDEVTLGKDCFMDLENQRIFSINEEKWFGGINHLEWKHDFKEISPYLDLDAIEDLLEETSKIKPLPEGEISKDIL